MRLIVLITFCSMLAACGTTKSDWLPQGTPVVYQKKNAPPAPLVAPGARDIRSTLKHAPDQFTIRFGNLKYRDCIDRHPRKIRPYKKKKKRSVRDRDRTFRCSDTALFQLPYPEFTYDKLIGLPGRFQGLQITGWNAYRSITCHRLNGSLEPLALYRCSLERY